MLAGALGGGVRAGGTTVPGGGRGCHNSGVLRPTTHGLCCGHFCGQDSAQSVSSEVHLPPLVGHVFRARPQMAPGGWRRAWHWVSVRPTRLWATETA